MAAALLAFLLILSPRPVRAVVVRDEPVRGEAAPLAGSIIAAPALAPTEGPVQIAPSVADVETALPLQETSAVPAAAAPDAPARQPSFFQTALRWGAGMLPSAPSRSAAQVQTRLDRAYDQSGPSRIEEQFTTVAGIRTRFIHAGKEHAVSGTPILFVHGFGGSVFAWRHAVPKAAKKHEVFAVDLVGFGRADKPRDYDYSLTSIADWLIKFMDDRGLQKVHLVGNSMGGAISLLTAEKAPSRVEKLVLIGPVAFPEDQMEGAWRFTAPGIGRITEWMLSWFPTRWLMKGLYMDESKLTDEVVKEYGHTLKSRGGRHAAAQVIRMGIPKNAEDHIARYSKIETPTLILAGDRDNRVKLSTFVRLAQTLPNARLRMIPGGGHVPHEDMPERTVPEFMSFLESNSPLAQPGPAK